MLERIYLALRRLLRHIVFDRPSGIETEGDVTMQELGLDPTDRVDYQPSGWLVLRPVLRPKDVTDSDVFLDFGCGKGRVLYLAAQYPFRRVVGVELSPELAGIARKNMQRALRQLKCTNVEVVQSDVLHYDVPDDVTVAYFNNPFEGEVFAGAVAKLVESLKRRPRVLRIIYYSPTQEETLLRAGAQLMKVAGASWPYRASPGSPTVRLYVLDGRAFA